MSLDGEPLQMQFVVSLFQNCAQFVHKVGRLSYFEIAKANNNLKTKTPISGYIFKFPWIFIEIKVDILHKQVTKEKQYTYTTDNEKIQAEVGFKDFEASNISSCFLRSTY